MSVMHGLVVWNRTCVYDMSKDNTLVWDSPNLMSKLRLKAENCHTAGIDSHLKPCWSDPVFELTTPVSASP